MDYVFPPAPQASTAVEGSAARFPVRRIFCVGRNYAAHAAEMGNEVDREAPFYFTKSPAAAVLTGASVPYPPGTEDCHHEMEFVVALGAGAYHGRLYFNDRTSMKESTGHGSPMPHLVHGGPGRAGGGEEMGGVRGVMHYMQRTSIQGRPASAAMSSGSFEKACRIAQAISAWPIWPLRPAV